MVIKVIVFDSDEGLLNRQRHLCNRNHGTVGEQFDHLILVAVNNAGIVKGDVIEVVRHARKGDHG